MGFESLRRSLLAGERVVAFTRADGGGLGARMLVWPDGRTEGALGEAALDREALALVTAATLPATGLREIEGVEVFVETFEPLPQLFIIGAVHVAIHLVHFARRLGFRTVVVDARSAFATAERFPHADELVVEWPSDYLARVPLHANTYCVFLTHDEKLDNPALQVALEAGVRYVGALGSSRTHAKRVAALREAGLADELIDRIHAPIGLDLGGRKPEEIAMAIAAELVAVRNGRQAAGKP
ncbi:MAG: xanthine dehydrogenase [Holophagales bacterium]|nr:xanthine dehydrogenase [Holophagales bacterium]MYC09583.1 xanthine dehydrogenase [Holophagales bacterium]